MFVDFSLEFCRGEFERMNQCNRSRLRRHFLYLSKSFNFYLLLSLCIAHAAIALAGSWNFFLVLLMIFQNMEWVQRFGRPVGVGFILFLVLLCIEVWLEKFINSGCSYCRSILLMTCFIVTYAMYVLLILYCMQIIG